MTGTSVAANPALNRRVGHEMRAIRRNKRLALRDVGTLSGGQFRPSVLGAYERGERTLSLPAFVALCTVYGADPSTVLDKATCEDIEPDWPAIGGRTDVAFDPMGGAA